MMRTVHTRCCGLDVHKTSVVACVMTPELTRTRSFGTMTADLLALADWLRDNKVSHVAMESSGVYWKPIYNLLEDEFSVMVVNARHMKAVPGRKTDMKDAEWIADLLRHGLLRASFIPERPQRELRELMRYRRSLVQERSRVVSRLQKVLEGGNIKLASVATDVVGKSGRAMLEAMVGGQEDPQALSEMSKGVLRRKKPELEQALRGLMGAHQRLMLDSQLRHLDFLDGEVARLGEEVEQRMRPFETALEQLDGLPGIGRRTAQEILAEIGTDMSRFPTSAHMASWARLCPGNNQSGGRRRNITTGKGNPWLQSALVEAAWSAVRARDNYFAAQYRRIAARRGKTRAIVAVAHSMLVTIHTMLSKGTSYKELGANYFDQRNHHYALHSAMRRIERLGYKVTIQTA